MPLARLRDATIFHEEVGTAGVPLLVAHGGLGIDHAYLRPWLDSLSAVARVVYYDHRGGGRSSRHPAPELTLDAWVDDLRGLSLELGCPRFALLGHSYGGWVAQEYATRFPDSLVGLVLCCTSGSPEDSGDPPPARVGGAARAALARLFDGSPVADDEELRRLMVDAMPAWFSRPDAALIESVDARTRYSAAAFDAGELAIAGWSGLERLGGLGVPALVIAGADDWLAPPAAAARLATAAGGELRVLDASGHYPFIEQHDRFVEAVTGWLEGLGRETIPCAPGRAGCLRPVGGPDTVEGAVEALIERAGGRPLTPAPFRLEQRSVDVFATLVHDVDPAHNDPAWARAAPFGGTIVQGVHMLSMLPALMAEVGLPVATTPERAVEYERLERARFVSPMAVGAEVRASVAVGPLERRAGGSASVRVAASLCDGRGPKPNFAARLRLRYEPHAPPRPGPAPGELPNGDGWRVEGDVSPLGSIDDFDGFFGDLQARVGGPLGRTRWHAVDQLAADCFGRVIGDFQPRYNTRGAGTPAAGPASSTTPRAPLVHPLYQLSLSVGLARDVGLPLVSDELQTVLNYGFDDVRWGEPPRVGERMRTHLWLRDVTRRESGYRVEIVHVSEVEGRPEPSMRATSIALWMLLDGGLRSAR